MFLCGHCGWRVPYDDVVIFFRTGHVLCLFCLHKEAGRPLVVPSWLRAAVDRD